MTFFKRSECANVLLFPPFCIYRSDETLSACSTFYCVYLNVISPAHMETCPHGSCGETHSQAVDSVHKDLIQ